jgi:putative FmdB family regulatory protein
MPVPLYEYQCPTCGRFEVIRKFSDPPLSDCPTCGKPITKLFSAPAIQFKGAGWYVTDYAKKSTNGEGKSGESASSSKEDKSASKDAPAPSSSASSSSKDTSAPSTPSSTTSSASGSSPSK